MFINIYNYEDKNERVEIDFDRLVVIIVEVISGDEVLTVVYKDGDVEYFDAAILCRDGRTDDSHYDWYTVKPNEVIKWDKRGTADTLSNGYSWCEDEI